MTASKPAASFGNSSGTTGGAYPVASGLPRAESIETIPSTPSANCKSAAALRKGGQAFASQKLLAFDDDENVVFARGKKAVDFFVSFELGGIGAEQLRQAVIDFEAQQPLHGNAGHQREQ